MTIGLYLIFAGIILVGTLGISQNALADMVSLPAEKDNTIFDEDGAESCGACEHLFVGQTFHTQDVRRALIEFDVSSIPNGSTITAVELEFNVSRTGDFIPVTMEVHEATTEWGEAGSTADGTGTGGGEGTGGPALPGDATWTDAIFNDTVIWTSPGGDFILNPSVSVSLPATTNIPLIVTTPSTASMVADVQGWVDNANSNHGWLLKLLQSEEDINGTTRAIDSREKIGGTPPMLKVTYTPPISDSDGDGVNDNVDNCVNDANANQYDIDNDNIGDVCDVSTDVSVSVQINDCHEFGGDVSITGGALMTFTSTGKAILPMGSSFSVSSTSGALLMAGSSLHISDSATC